MKILHIINNLGSGGAEKLIEETIPLLNNNSGLLVELLLLTDKDNVFEKALKSAHIKIGIIPLKKMRSPLNIFYIRNYIIQGAYDIVHVHLFPAQYWTAMACMLIFKNKPRLITTEHNTTNRRRKKKYFRYIDQFIYSKIDKIVSISDATKRSIDSWLNLTSKNAMKSVVIENGINLGKFKSAEEYYKHDINVEFSNETKLLCMVGRFTTQKDHQTLIKALARLPEYIHLLLVGEGEQKDVYESLALKLEVDDRVHFLGFRNDIERILKTVDMVILSSKWEGFGLAALEGMSSGKLVLGTNVEGLAEVIGDEDLLFEVGNDRELAEKIMMYLNDTQLYLKKTNAGLIRSSKYSISNMTARYIELYQKV
ncbi:MULTISPECIES: glycosyltransferase [unclassified Paenibacillus]|uniref:glycosyltransferase n=1 Tax=unclassified Paenibacillus TaxID=185978 RepID=UPI00240578F7|nr:MULTISPECIES: glycosyltransferase [unclassified Paenibacillus]MDF9844048.1 glycosyltransferase involved in cell wall biosynthesis [Paenibacillus sp. PastF-2]MDF9850653.1 glycosyltransferase involved in cell wall biosynthesis [Paenibacillus sp. PastM-2]MDF9857196.1 glycosyltransferase involved in cell wall biosynthesis [Paenibacillus sp. PastF-1]MDH6482503.1 glycosyltransferase involved in cell wall biosynthesis [Paenibacillus sp. PastH-2]MDH6509894.1 glycosyltransferase involved in cell wal